MVSSSPQLNQPPAVSRTPLAVQPETPARHIERMLNVNHYHRSPSRTIYSDRFIPSRSGSNFGLFDIKSPTNSQTDDTSSAYTTLLRATLFGPDSAGVIPPATPDRRGLMQMNPPNQNIFRYKSETRRSMHSLLPFGFDDDVVTGVHHSPVKTPRKVPKSPYKVKL